MGDGTRDIADRIAIDDLLTAYAVAIDQRDWDGVRACFTLDASLDYSTFGAPQGSVDEVVGWLQKALSRIGVTQHHITNRRVVLEGDTATAVSYVLNPMMIGEALTQVGGAYHDALRRTPDGWRIESRVAEYRWSNPPIGR